MKATDVIRAALRMSEFDIRLIEDMRDAPLTQPTARGGNHPLWVLGHLAWAEGGLSGMIHGEPNPVERWAKHFSSGTEPTTDAAHYPPFDEVFAKYGEVRARTMALLDGIDDAELDRPLAAVPPGLEDFFRTVGDVLTFIPIHRSSHMGQVADARRAAGRGPLAMPEPPAAS